MRLLVRSCMMGAGGNAHPQYAWYTTGNKMAP